MRVKTWKVYITQRNVKEQIFRSTRHRAGKLIAEPPIWLTSSGENSENPQRGGERGGGGGGGSGIHPCLYVRKLSVFSFKASLCAGVREGGLLYTGYFKLKRDCKSPCDVSVYASIELECPGRYHQVHQINRSLFRTNIIDTTPILWWWNKLHWFIKQA